MSRRLLPLLLVFCLAGCGSAHEVAHHAAGGADPKLVGTEATLATEVLLEAQQNAISNSFWARFTPTTTGTLEKLEVHTGAAANTATKMLLGIAEATAGETFPKAILTECEAKNGGSAFAANTTYTCNVSPTITVSTGSVYWLAAAASEPAKGTLHVKKGAISEVRLVEHSFPPCAKTKLSECQETESKEVSGEGRNGEGFEIKGMGSVETPAGPKQVMLL